MTRRFHGLQVVEDSAGFVIAWTDEADVGLRIGDTGDTEAELRATLASDPENHEWAAVELVGIQIGSADARAVRERDQPFRWKTRHAATKALRKIVAQASALLDNPGWPEWALQARAAGWTPPEGWKP